VIEFQFFNEKCPKCTFKLREIKKDYFSEYIDTGTFKGFKHRYVCPKCGNEGIYNTITDMWTNIKKDLIHHYGKKGNRLLYKSSKNT
jgi:uncharacterized protein with PIN domain